MIKNAFCSAHPPGYLSRGDNEPNDLVPTHMLTRPDLLFACREEVIRALPKMVVGGRRPMPSKAQLPSDP
jgi:hypothetical protein